MCSIVGCVGTDKHIANVFEGLRRLEYRGYDSAGCAGIDRDTIRVEKQVGGVDELVDAWRSHPFDAATCIGHTRWATHGRATSANAHPHVDMHNTVAIVHNGIIENEREIRQRLHDLGYALRSETDSELIAHVFGYYVQQYADSKTALLATVNDLEGSYAICAMSKHDPYMLLGARKGSPLCIGHGKDSHIIASDVAGCAVIADRVTYLPEESCALVASESVSLYDLHGNPINYQHHPIDHTFIASSKDGYPHYMLKEIYEQKRVVRDTITWFYDHYQEVPDYMQMGEYDIQSLRSVTMAACGTSYFSSVIGTYYINDIACMPAYAWIASEFRYRFHEMTIHDCFLVLSQSGETADTLEALRSVRNSAGSTIGIINAPSSSIEREAHGHIFTHAKQEVSVASTKSFTAQLTVMYWLAYYFGYIRGERSAHELNQVYAAAMYAAEQAESYLVTYTPYLYDHIAPRYAASSYMIFLGKHIMYPLAQEAALKLQELAYIPSYAYPSGELKHGPLALIYTGTPVVLFSAQDEHLYRKVIASAQEVKARGGEVIVFAFEGQDALIELADVVFTFPCVDSYLAPIVMAPLVQAFAYYIARHLSCPIDKPRNLAKSVTVE